MKDSLLGPKDTYRYVECPNQDETLTFAQILKECEVVDLRSLRYASAGGLVSDVR